MSDVARKIKASCPCCGFATLTDFTYWSYELCPVCFWQNDPLQREDASYVGGANGLALREARGNFICIGACCPEAVFDVRPPHLEEMPFLRGVSELDQEQRTAAVRLRKAQMLTVLRGMRQGAIPALDGCSAIATLDSGLAEGEIRTNLRTLWVVAAEVDELPQGAVRDLWSPDALAQKDAEWQEYERRMRDEINTACEEAEKSLREELNA